jgi:hypothetical protein
MKQNEGIPPILKVASMLGITLLTEDAVKLLHLIELLKSEAFNTGVAVERQRCIKICEDNMNSGEMWWDSAMGFLAENIKGEKTYETK